MQSKRGVALDRVMLMQVTLDFPPMQVILPPLGLVAFCKLVHTSPKYGSLAGIVIGIQSGSVEPHGQLFWAPVLSNSSFDYTVL